MIAIDYGAFLAIALGLAIWFMWRPPLKSGPAVGVSTLGLFGQVTTLRTHLVNLPRHLLIATLTFFLLGLLDFHWKGGTIYAPPGEGVALMLVLDRSRSMSEPVVGGGTKLEMLKQVASAFVANRPNDLLGLIAFARGGDVLVPLTLDHSDVQRQLKLLNFVDDFNQDGTAMGYALYKGANLLEFVKGESQKSPYKIKNRAVVMVTDGFQNPNPLDLDNRLRSMGLEEAAATAASLGVKLYLINVDPRMTFDDFAPHRQQMMRAAALTGGKVFFVDHQEALDQVFQKINSLEKSPIPTLLGYSRTTSATPIFIALGMVALLCSVFTGTTYLRRYP